MRELVLIVDDEPGIVTELTNILHDEGYRVAATGRGEEAIEIYIRERPAVVFLDIWLPDRDGLETLQALKQIDPAAAVIMMSGHGTTPTAVRAIKMGAENYLEKPFTLAQVVESVATALAAREKRVSEQPAPRIESGVFRLEPVQQLAPPPMLSIVRESDIPQRTVKESMVIYGLGLHSGARTGMAIQPLPPDSGIHFVTVPSGTEIPAYLSSVADTEWATTLSRYGDSIKTTEHLLASLHAAGITNLLVKVHGEIPVLDGSAVEFCNHLAAIGIVDQDRPRRELVVDQRYEITGSNGRSLVIEPAEVLSVRYELRYPAPIGEQQCDFTLTSFEAFRAEIAPARTFGFLRDLPMLAELGIGAGGRLDNCILVGEDKVINTELRFPDEYARHKVLDIIGDLYLLGYPVRGRVSARWTGHRDNIALQQLILAQSSGQG